MNVCGPVDAGRHSRPHFMKCFLLGSGESVSPVVGGPPLQSAVGSCWGWGRAELHRAGQKSAQAEAWTGIINELSSRPCFFL